MPGDVAAALDSTGATVTDAFRYDAYGETIDATKSSLPSPWRYQGRLLLNDDANSDLYDFVFRSYDPGLGTFLSLDDAKGSAQNPITFNRFLYASANPETMVDPDGHWGEQAACLVLVEAPPAAGLCAAATTVVDVAATLLTAALVGVDIGQAIKVPTSSTIVMFETVPANARPEAGPDPGLSLTKPRVTDSSPTQTIRQNQRIEPRNPDEFPLEPGGACSSMRCKVGVLGTLIALAGTTIMSGVAPSSVGEGETPERILEEIEDLRSRLGFPNPKIGPAKSSAVPTRTPPSPVRIPPRPSFSRRVLAQ